MNIDNIIEALWNQATFAVEDKDATSLVVIARRIEQCQLIKCLENRLEELEQLVDNR